MQRYGDFWLIPNNKPYSLQSCCDGLGNLRQREGYRIKYVVRGSCQGAQRCQEPLCLWRLMMKKRGIKK